MEKINVNAVIPTAQSFKYCLGQLVNIRISDEWGEIQARSQHVNGGNQYYIHYQSANGCATDRWYSESQLSAVEDERSPGMPVFASVDLPDGAFVEE